MLPLIDPAIVFVIVPAYNEQQMLPVVLESLLEPGYQVVLIDDGSEPALTPPVSTPRFYTVRHLINRGQGAALQTGIRIALSKGARYIVTFDADGQHQAATIPVLLEPLLAGTTDVVLGSRFLEVHSLPPGRRLLLQVARYINFVFTGLLLSDAHNGLRAFSATAATHIRLQESRMAHATEIIMQIKAAHLRFTEVPVQIMYTDYSRKKGQRFRDSFRILSDLILYKLFK